MHRHLQTGRALRLAILLLALGLAIGLLVWTIRDRAGVGREIVVSGTEQCERIPAPAGPEDLQIDALLGVAFISAHDRRARPPANGDIHLLALDEPDAEIVPVPRDGPEAFIPHGLSLVRVDGTLYLHVVNHAGGDGSSVEQFRFEDGRLHHLATVRDAALHSPNDVAAVDERRFYATNDHGNSSAIGRFFEQMLGLYVGDVQYFDGLRMTTAATGQSFANGIVLSADGRRVLVAQTIGSTINSYLRDADTGALTPESYMPLETGPDNLNVAADGSIWTVGHPRVFDFLAHSRDSAALSPTDVYRIDFHGLTADSHQVLMDDGRVLSGGSAADVRGDQLLVGNVFEPYLLRCTLPRGLAVHLPPPEDAGD